MRHLSRACDVAEVGVPRGDQLVHHVLHRHVVLRPHGRQPARGHWVADHHRRQAELLHQGHPLVARQQVDEDHALYLAVPRPGPHPLGGLRHRGHDLEQHRHPERDQDALHAGDEIVEERLRAQHLGVPHQGEPDRSTAQRAGPVAGRGRGHGGLPVKGLV